MSGSSYDGLCPRCGELMDWYSEWKPFDTTSGYCLACGFAVTTLVKTMSKKLLRIMRKDEKYSSPDYSTETKRFKIFDEQWGIEKRISKKSSSNYSAGDDQKELTEK